MQAPAPPLLPLLRSRLQAELLTLVLLTPDREWTLTELASRVGGSVSSAQREMARAEQTGVVKSRRLGQAEVKNRLSEVVERLEREHSRVVITKHGHPAAVVISVEDLESLEESLDVLDSGALLADIREALGELAAGESPVLGKDQALRPDPRPVSEPGCAVVWTGPARRALARLPEKVATAAVEFLYGSLAASPRRVGNPLKLGLTGLHRARRGDYRVTTHDHRIDGVAIEHRSDVYRPQRS